MIRLLSRIFHRAPSIDSALSAFTKATAELKAVALNAEDTINRLEDEVAERHRMLNEADTVRARALSLAGRIEGIVA